MFSEVVVLYLKRVCPIKNTITYYWWEFSTWRFRKASFLLVTKQPSTGHRSFARPGLDDDPALLSDVHCTSWKNHCNCSGLFFENCRIRIIHCPSVLVPFFIDFIVRTPKESIGLVYTASLVMFIPIFFFEQASF